MYQLTCPTCRFVTESPFVRNGAVVRCAACEGKYRIKSSHIEHVLTTGPRTLDEAETVLRSDSVDIDPDEVAPVSIDDEGNVVGLSGLSELMRQSDQRGAKEKVQARMDGAEEQPIQAGVGRGAGGAPAVERLDDMPEPGSAAQRRARLLARRKQKRTNALLLAALGCLVVVGGVVLFILMGPGAGSDADGDGQSAAGGGDDAGAPGGPGGSAAAGDGNDPPDPPGPGTQDPTPGDPGLFVGIGPPSPNPDPRYRAPFVRQSADTMPADVPTVVIPARKVAHEGWYIMQPPRGAAGAAGAAGVEVGELKPVPTSDGQTLLAGTVRNQSEQALLGGEMHVMLLDSSGGVFAETYMPLVMIGPGQEQQVRLPIATRHWRRARGVRTSAQVNAWSPSLSPIPGVKADPVGTGEHAALRVSAFHVGGTALRNVMILIEAVDSQGALIARFMVENEKLYVGSQTWLDLIVATPLAPDQNGIRWSATVQPR